MTNLEEITKGYAEVQKYEYGSVAYRAMSKEDEGTAIGALRKFSKDGKDSEHYEGFVEYTLDSPEGRKHAAKFYGEKHGKALEKMPLSYLYSARYGSLIDSYLSDQNKENVINTYNEFADKTYGDIIKKYLQAKEKVDSKTGNFSDGDKAEAQKTIEKYEKIFYLLNLLEEAKYEELRPGAAKEGIKAQFKNYAENFTQAKKGLTRKRRN